jgi:hypothetical protein
MPGYDLGAAAGRAVSSTLSTQAATLHVLRCVAQPALALCHLHSVDAVQLARPSSDEGTFLGACS